MLKSTSNAYRLFRAAARRDPLPSEVQYPVRELAALPPLEPPKRCTCGSCRACLENARWDRIFAKFEVKETEVRGLYACPLAEL
jgi:hypothetical protein